MEGPSLVILKELLQPFKGKIIRNASGSTTKIDTSELINKKIIDFESWGKHLLIVFEDFSLRIHFLMFGSYRINERKSATPRIHLAFRKGELNFYTCSVAKLEGALSEVYDWSVDVMRDEWSPRRARRSIKKYPYATVSDILLDQNIFAGVGNIIKNEVLFRIRVHPETLIKDLPPRKLTALIEEARNYTFDFYKWKKGLPIEKALAHLYKAKVCELQGSCLQKIYRTNTKKEFFFVNDVSRL